MQMNDRMEYDGSNVDIGGQAVLPQIQGGLLHQMVSYPFCCSLLLNFAIAWHPALLHKTDQDGNTLLHRLLEAKRHDRLLLRPAGNENMAYWLQTKQDPAPLVKLLLGHCPKMPSIANQHGVYPLQIAASLPWSKTCHERLLEGDNVAVLDVCGFPDLLYPYLLAKIGGVYGRRNRNLPQIGNIDLIFRILKMKPHLFCGASSTRNDG